MVGEVVPTAVQVRPDRAVVSSRRFKSRQQNGFRLNLERVQPATTTNSAEDGGERIQRDINGTTYPSLRTLW